MHEFSLLENILSAAYQVAKDNHLKSINKIHIKVGALRQVTPEIMQFAFATLAKNTMAAVAELIIEEEPLRLLCDTCQHEFVAEELTYVCPRCQQTKLQIISGKELLIESIEGESENENHH